MEEWDKEGAEESRRIVREAVSEMMNSDGWHYFRQSLIEKRNQSMTKIISILPTEANLPLYGEIRAQVRFIDEILSLRAIDIMESVEKHE